MGVYVNKSNEGFKAARRSEYVDKSLLIAETNRLVDTRQNLLCVSRPRRFGKSMAAEMLLAYYCNAYNSESLFADLRISSDADYKTYLNRYPVIYLDITEFSTLPDKQSIVANIQRCVIDDLNATCGTDYDTSLPLMFVLRRHAISTGQKFIFIIDEWDALCREFEHNAELMRNYVDLLRNLFKSGSTSEVFAMVYMTGILPIIKYDTQSALNNFREYSMITPGQLAPYIGFTDEEVRMLCERHDIGYSEMKSWYNGYNLPNVGPIYNANSVMTAIANGRCSNYWTKTAAYESVAAYINMNFDGLRDDVIGMLGGQTRKVNTTKFSNQMQKVNSKDDVFTVLIHLGYLGFCEADNSVYIPNFEVEGEFRNAIEDCSWGVVARTLQNADQLLDDAIAGNADKVAFALEQVHSDTSSILKYNDENSLSCALSIAFFTARAYYMVVREMPAGKGFADFVMVPNADNINRRPAMIVELKYNQSADTAISQIKEKRYPDALCGYMGDVVLVGINYSPNTKQHTCKIERIRKKQ